MRLVDVIVHGSFAGRRRWRLFWLDGGSLVLERSTVAGNTTNGEGGGVHVTSGRLIATGTPLAPSTISGNAARNGGGIYNAGALSPAGQHGAGATWPHTTSRGNVALNSGGGIDNQLEGRLIARRRHLHRQSGRAATAAASPAAPSRASP